MTARNELAALVAYVFQTLGRRRIGDADWVRVLSLDRKWVQPSTARRLAGAAREAGLLRNAGERDYEIGLEAEGIPLPVDYRPDVNLLAALPGPADPAAAASPDLPLFRRIVQRIARDLNQSEPDVISRVNTLQHSTGDLLSAEVAALYLARLNDVDMHEFFEAVAQRLRASPT